MMPTAVAEWLLPGLVSLPWAEASLTLIAFAAGATVGSFLNVVAYRLPRGESVVRGCSRCPCCGTRVRPRDNVPVIGWLLLGGRCRDCGAPIAAAYPSVEAGCGLLVATLAVVHLAGAGRVDAAGASASMLDRWFVRGDMMPLARWLYDAALLLVLAAWSLLAARGHRPAAASRAVVIAAAAVAALVIQPPPPGVRWDGGIWPPDDGPVSTAVAILAGTVVGMLVERIAPWTGVAGGPALIGASSGWQAVLLQAVLRGIIAALRLLSDPRRGDAADAESADSALIRERIATWLAAATFVIITRDFLRPD